MSESRLATLAATCVLQGFDGYVTRFAEISRRARGRFLAQDWQGARADTQERLALYGEITDAVIVALRELLVDRTDDRVLWSSIKAVYSALIVDRQDWELAETFHNSITRKVFVTVGVDDRIEFVDTDFGSPPTPALSAVYTEFPSDGDLTRLVETIVTSHFDQASFADLRDDADEVAERIASALALRGGLVDADRVETARAVFYRGQAAYIIGLLYSGSARIPIVIGVRHRSGGLGIDVVLLTENEVSILFSFTRSHFLVEIDRPYDLVRFLRRLMPKKRIAELYIAIGLAKHGKTELYRDLIRHVRSTDEKFDYVPGTTGLVMIVFGMPGYDDVFKVIRDTFPPPKKTTRSGIVERYELVSRADRAGRLIDAQNFQHLSFSRDRFASGLLAELLSQASKTVRVEGDRVVIGHMYVERRVIPLDVYTRAAVDSAARAAVLDYGQAIKDLACSNIFPGDLLTKNFGVTRHGRVVFYDYDEISPLTDVVFRKLPPARTDEDEYAEGAWFGVGPRDVFPEEHRRFLGMSAQLADTLIDAHEDLFDVDSWREVQVRISSGELIEILPYSPLVRLSGAPEVSGWR